MDRDTVQAEIECLEYAEDVLESSMQLLKQYLQPGLTKADEDKELFSEKCAEIFSYAYELRRNLPDIFDCIKKTKKDLGSDQIMDDVYCRKDRVSFSKLLARIAFIQIKEKEAALVLDTGKKSELIHCFRSLFEPLEREILRLLQDVKVKGLKLSYEKEEIKEKRLEKSVGEIFEKIEEVDLTLRLMTFDVPVEAPLEEENLQTHVPRTESEERLSTSQSEEVLDLRKRCAEAQDAYCRAKHASNLFGQPFSCWGCGGTASFDQEAGLACIESFELYLNTCLSLFFDSLSKIDSMNNLEMGLAWTDSMNRVSHIEQFVDEIFLVLDAF